MLTVHGRNTKQRVPVEGLRFEPNPQTPLQRGTSPLEIWYSGVVNQTAYTTAASVINNDFIYPITIGKAAILSKIAFEVTATGGAGSVGRCGIYKSTSKTNLYPSSLVVDGGEFDTSAVGGTGTKITTGLSILMTPGLYWLAFICGTAAPTLRIRGVGACDPSLGIISTMGATPTSSFNVARTYAAFPSTFSGTLSASGSTRQVIHLFFSS